MSERPTPSRSSIDRSVALMERARKVIPGGVNSPVRSFSHVGGSPRFIERGDGAYFFDSDGNRYLDYVGSWGPLILGHNSDVVRNALLGALSAGTSYGAPTEREVVFAEELTAAMPALEMVRFVSSGTEATMTAIRLARGATGRDLLIKFDGHYHGHADTLLVKAGSGVATLGIAGSAGVPKEVAKLTLSIEFNDLNLFKQTIEEAGPQNVAAVIVEPVPGNMGLVLPEPGFLEGVRQITAQHGIVLIFDEVMTGFRVGFTGACGRFNIRPDLVTYGKVIGGGLPVGAVGGSRAVMENLAPVGTVYQAGTLSGNPLALAAGIAAFRYLRDNDPYPALEELGGRFVSGMHELGKELGIPLVASSCGSMIGMFFSRERVRSYTEARATDIELFKRFFHAMLDEGIYLAPSAFEAGFLSTCHTVEHIDQTIDAARRCLKAVR